MKKILALVVAMLLVLGMTSALAASVTVSNPGAEKTYTYYKVFDITYGNDAQATEYTATTPTDDFLTALRTTDSPFTVEETVIDNVYNIGIKDTKTAADIRDWLATQTDNLTAHVGDTFEDGFYLMTVTNADGDPELATTFEVKGEDVTILDKNQSVPGPDKQESVDEGTNWLYQGINNTSDDTPTASIGDLVQYKVVGDFPKYDGTDLVKKLKFTDTMSKGLTYDSTTGVSLTINGDPVSVTPSVSTNAETGITTLVIEVPTVNASGAFLYNAENSYVLTYGAYINEDAIDNTNEQEENTVHLTYDAGDVVDREGGSDSTRVKSYDLTLEKVDAQTTTKKLPGAKFVLYTAGGSTPINVVLETGTGDKDSTVDNVYRLADHDDTTGIITEMVTGQTGKIVVKGLENGSYEFEETEAPDGYNKLTARTDAQTITNANVSFTVGNNTGTQLPSTGGIGTTIFYVAGGILVLAAVILLVTKRRMKAED